MPRNTLRRRLPALALLAMLAAGLVLAGPSLASGPRARISIVGGGAATQGELPFMAFVDDSAAGFACSGTVISRDLVLTAAHCAVDAAGTPVPLGGYQIVAGSSDWQQGAAGQLLGVSRVIVNPGYDRVTGTGDAALLVLSSPTTARSMALAGASDAALVASGTPVEAAGWGLTSASARALPTALQKATSTIQSTAYCAQTVQADGATFDPADSLCAIDAPLYASGTCHGDSGGPLLALRPGGTLVEVGITRSGDSNCSTTFPDVFTRVDTISAWAASWISAVGHVGAQAVATASGVRMPGLVEGLYRGLTGQHAALTLRVGGAARAVTSLSVQSALACGSARRRVRLSIRPSPPWAIKPSTLSFDDVAWAGGARFRVTGTFTPAGGLSGTIRAAARSQRDGVCKWGAVPFHALVQS